MCHPYIESGTAHSYKKNEMLLVCGQGMLTMYYNFQGSASLAAK